MYIYENADLALNHVISVFTTASYSTLFIKHLDSDRILWRCHRDVMVNAMDWGIIVSEFVLQSCYYVHIRKNILGKGMKPLILPAMG